MANVLQMEKKIQVVSALAEGNSIRSIERMTGIHRDTIMRLGVKVGEGCADLISKTMVDLPCKNIELDEIWGFVGKKQGNLKKEDNRAQVGNVWTYVALDQESKVVPCFKIGNRSRKNTFDFLTDLSSRLKNRVQITSDAMNAYEEAMEKVFGTEVDYGQVVKTFSTGKNEGGKYSPAQLVSSEKTVLIGTPNKDTISTSFVERQNLTMRMHIRRLTRLTNAFSKKIENFKAAIALHFGYYNFVKVHKTLRATPAMACGVTKEIWTMGDLLEKVQ
jgi:IS1 family transposase